MKSWKLLVALIVALMATAQAGAQSETPDSRTMQAKDAEVDRRLHEAERQMAEAARLVAELTAERLPHREMLQRRLEIIGDGGPRLGVTIGGEDENPVKGVGILGVTPGSAAEEAGLRAGDLITSVNGETMAGDDSDDASQKLLDFMAGVEEGDKLQIEYLRQGKSGKVEVEPRAIEAQVFAFGFDGRNARIPGATVPMIAPGVGGSSPYVFEWHSHDGWGDMELVELNAGLGKYFGTDQGLLVVNAPESKALQLEDGDVIQKIDGREPTSVRHALRILSSYQSGETLQLEIMRDKKSRTLEVEVPDGMSSGLVPEVAPAVRPARAPAPVRPTTPIEKT